MPNGNHFLDLIDTVRYYDMIRYDTFTCAQKLTKWPASSSAWHINKKLRKKIKTKTDYRISEKNGAGESP